MFFRMKESDDQVIIANNTSALKPLLTPAHQIQEVCYALMHINCCDDNSYNGFNQTVHMQSKWLSLTCNIAPKRKHIYKNHVTWVMFLAEIAQPR
jgi:hypothetical protein